MSYFLYALESVSYHRLYYGTSGNVAVRLKQHNKGLVKSTRPYRPWKVIKIQSFATKQEAQKRERQIKRSGWARKQIKKQVRSKP